MVCVLDDLHWGEETFLELVEEVGDLAREAPILLLCMSRPELLQRRPGWGSGKMNTTTALLQPLDDVESDRMLDELDSIQAGGEQGKGLPKDCASESASRRRETRFFWRRCSRWCADQAARR